MAMLSITHIDVDGFWRDVWTHGGQACGKSTMEAAASAKWYGEAATTQGTQLQEGLTKDARAWRCHDEMNVPLQQLVEESSRSTLSGGRRYAIVSCRVTCVRRGHWRFCACGQEWASFMSERIARISLLVGDGVGTGLSDEAGMVVLIV